MSTEYAVKLSLPDFLEQSVALGFKPQLHRENDGEKIRLRLVDGSERGCVYDPREERASDGSIWTLFTRYGLNDVSGLSMPLGAIDEYGQKFEDLFHSKGPSAVIDSALAEHFEQSAVESDEVASFIETVLDVAQRYRDEQRDWAVPYEQGPLPSVTTDTP